MTTQGCTNCKAITCPQYYPPKHSPVDATARQCVALAILGAYAIGIVVVWCILALHN